MYNYSYAAEKAWDNLYDSDFRDHEGFDPEDEEQAERDEQLRQEALEDRFQAEREGE